MPRSDTASKVKVSQGSQLVAEQHGAAEDGGPTSSACSPSGWRWAVALGLITITAAILRCWHMATDMPDFLEEAAPFRTALQMWAHAGGRIDWNPHSFIYPSLTIYLHLLLQMVGYWVAYARSAVNSPADWWLLLTLDPTPAVLPARIVHIGFDLATVILTGIVAQRLRRGAGLPAALLAALSPTLLGTSRLIYTDTVMTTLTLAALERMLAWHERGGAGRLVGAAILIGLAAGAKYPGAIALVPLAWLSWHRRRTRGLALWLLATAGSAAVFLVTTPYALLDLPELKRDLSVHVLHVAGGHLGQPVGSAGWTYLNQLLHDLGPAGLALLVVSASISLVRGSARPRLLASWVLLLAFLAPTATAHYALANYLVPVVPIAMGLAAAAAIETAGWLKPVYRLPATTALLAALLVPVFIGGARAASAGARFTQVEARRWLEARLTSRDFVLAEAWGPRLPTLGKRLAVLEGPLFASAHPLMQERYLAQRWFHLVELPLTVAGRVASRLVGPSGTHAEIVVFPSALDLNGIAYDPRLLATVDFVVTSDAVRGRFEADPERFPKEMLFYRLLDAQATVEACFTPHGSLGGPVITIYRLGPQARATIARAGPLPPMWWAEGVPDDYRRSVVAFFRAPWNGGAALEPDGTAALWVRSLARVYQDSLYPFVMDMASNVVDLDRCDAAQPLVEGTLLVAPRDPFAVRLYEICTGRAPTWRR